MFVELQLCHPENLTPTEKNFILDILMYQEMRCVASHGFVF